MGTRATLRFDLHGDYVIRNGRPRGRSPGEGHRERPGRPVDLRRKDHQDYDGARHSKRLPAPDLQKAGIAVHDQPGILFVSGTFAKEAQGMPHCAEAPQSRSQMRGGRRFRFRLSRLLKKILGEGSLSSSTSFLRAFSRSLYARIANFLAFGHTSPRVYAEGTTAKFLIRT